MQVNSLGDVCVSQDSLIKLRMVPTNTEVFLCGL